MDELGRPDRRRLLAIARGAIEGALCRDARLEVDTVGLSPALRRPTAAFVTLREQGELRGCVGSLRFDRPLWTNVRAAAVDAAFEDPRFMPVGSQELPFLEIEISVLEPPHPLADPAGFAPGRHGIIVQRGLRMGLLLPQVATEMGWGTADMLAAACRKAGLADSAWHDRSTKLSVFEASHFSELDLAEPADVVPAGNLVG